jgi:hypothetical protein
LAIAVVLAPAFPVPLDRRLERDRLGAKLAEWSGGLWEALTEGRLAEVTLGAIEAVCAAGSWCCALTGETNVAVGAAHRTVSAATDAGCARGNARAFEAFLADVAADGGRSAKQR